MSDGGHDGVQIPLVLEYQRRSLGQEEGVADEPATNRGEQGEHEDADVVVALLDSEQRSGHREQEDRCQLEFDRKLELACDGIPPVVLRGSELRHHLGQCGGLRRGHQRQYTEQSRSCSCHGALPFRTSSVR